MDESNWLASIHPAAMLELFRGKIYSNDFRRFAIACCRRIRHVDQPWFQNVLAATEQYLDGNGTEASVIAARNELQRIADLTSAKETDNTPPLERFDWDALTAFRAASDRRCQDTHTVSAWRLDV